jgi:hypothetical protein
MFKSSAMLLFGKVFALNLRIKPSFCLEFLGPNPSREALRPCLFISRTTAWEKRNRIAEQAGIAEDLPRKLPAWVAQADPAELPRGPLNEQERNWCQYYLGVCEPSRR